ncbi:hypothetical protein [Streptomyces sp. 13-12-16]|uniref:hypothetical protein n=1 Tax=Streptomyces sp. 13-12-16 TaxID=1570823 RepID=UPI0026783D28
MISTLGVPYGRNPVTVYSEGITHITRAMTEHGVRRLVCVTSTLLFDVPAPGETFFFRKVLEPFIARTVARTVKAARVPAGYASRRTEDLDVHYPRVNGDDAAVLFTGDSSPYAVMVMDLTPDGDQVSGVYVVTNPAKLTHVRPDDGQDPPGEDTPPNRPGVRRPPAPGEHA